MRALTVVLALLTTQCFAGSIYKYVDESGRTVFTNVGSERAGAQPSLASLATKGSGKATVPEVTAAPRTPDQNDPLAEFLPLIQDSAARHGVDQELIKAIIKVESNFNPNAVSNKGCKGLMQLHPDTAKRFGVKNIFDPAENIEGGVKFLKFLLDYFQKDMPKVLAAYNAGENAVVRYKGIPPYKETKGYVKKVEALYSPSEMAAVSLPEPTERARKRVFRVTQPDGSVLFTTEPVEMVDGVAN